MNAKQAFKILGLEPDANLLDIKRAYRDLAKVWHPDRFQNDPRLRLKAEETLKRINEAYRLLQSASGRPTPEPSPTQEEQAGETSQLPVSLSELRSWGVPEKQLPAVLRGMQVLSEQGLAAQDIADVIGTSCSVLDALADGDYEKATKLAFEYVAECVEELLACMPEEQLRVLCEAGLAVGEIVQATHTVVGFRKDMKEGDSETARQYARALLDSFRTGGRTTRRSKGTYRARQYHQRGLRRDPDEKKSSPDSPAPEYPTAQSEAEIGGSATSAAATPSTTLATAHQLLFIAALMGLVALVAVVSNGARMEHPGLFAIFLIAVFIPTIVFIVRGYRKRHGKNRGQNWRDYHPASKPLSEEARAHSPGNSISKAFEEDDEDAAGYRAFHRIPSHAATTSVPETGGKAPIADNSTRRDAPQAPTQDDFRIISEEEARQIAQDLIASGRMPSLDRFAETVAEVQDELQLVS